MTTRASDSEARRARGADATREMAPVTVARYVLTI
jgi:hypothetical protein